MSSLQNIQKIELLWYLSSVICHLSVLNMLSRVLLCILLISLVTSKTFVAEPEPWKANKDIETLLGVSGYSRIRIPFGPFPAAGTKLLISTFVMSGIGEYAAISVSRTSNAASCSALDAIENPEFNGNLSSNVFTTITGDANEFLCVLVDCKSTSCSLMYVSTRVLDTDVIIWNSGSKKRAVDVALPFGSSQFSQLDPGMPLGYHNFGVDQSSILKVYFELPTGVEITVLLEYAMVDQLSSRSVKGYLWTDVSKDSCYAVNHSMVSADGYAPNNNSVKGNPDVGIVGAYDHEKVKSTHDGVGLCVVLFCSNIELGCERLSLQATFIDPKLFTHFPTPAPTKPSKELHPASEDCPHDGSSWLKTCNYGCSSPLINNTCGYMFKCDVHGGCLDEYPELGCVGECVLISEKGEIVVGICLCCCISCYIGCCVHCCIRCRRRKRRNAGAVASAKDDQQQLESLLENVDSEKN